MPRLVGPEPSHRTVLLLTATVTPNSSAYDALTSKTRLAQYQESIAWWSSELAGSLVELAVVETSGADSEALLARSNLEHRSLIHVVSHRQAQGDIAMGKGAMEFAAIESAFESLGLEHDDVVYKATGRLKIGNHRRVLTSLDGGSIAIRMTLDHTFADTRLVGATVGTWQRELLPARALVDDSRGVYIEHAVASRIGAAAPLGLVEVVPFKARPEFRGTAGSTGRRDSAGRAALAGRAFGWLEGRARHFASRKQV